MGYPEFPDPTHDHRSTLPVDHTGHTPSLFEDDGTMSSDLVMAHTKSDEGKYLVAEAMRIANDISGVEYESFQDWLDHVDLVIERINRG